MEAVLRVTYFSTGQSPYLKGRGKPVVADEITAAILLNKGSIVRTLDELNGAVKADTEEVVQHPDIIADVVVEVRELPKVERRARATKRVVPKKNTKVSKK